MSSNVPPHDSGEITVCVAKLLKPHGVHGQIKARIFLEEAALLSKYPVFIKGDPQPIMCVLRSLPQEGIAILSLDTVSSRDIAEKISGEKLWLDASHLPPTAEDEFYHHQLNDLMVTGSDGSLLGKVTEVHDYGAGAIIEVCFKSGKTELYPFNAQSIQSVDLANQTLCLSMPEEIWVRPHDEA